MMKKLGKKFTKEMVLLVHSLFLLKLSYIHNRSVSPNIVRNSVNVGPIYINFHSFVLCYTVFLSFNIFDWTSYRKCILLSWVDIFLNYQTYDSSLTIARRYISLSSSKVKIDLIWCGYVTWFVTNLTATETWFQRQYLDWMKWPFIEFHPFYSKFKNLVYEARLLLVRNWSFFKTFIISTIIS